MSPPVGAILSKSVRFTSKTKASGATYVTDLLTREISADAPEVTAAETVAFISI